jgi:hypothetical protein
MASGDSRLRRWAAACLLLWALSAQALAQQSSPSAPAEPPAAREDTRTQYPPFLANSYFGVNVGSLFYAFTQRQLEPGFHAGSIAAPHAAARVALFGHELTPAVSVEVTYMRPVRFVTYRNINGDEEAHHVWTGFGGAAVKGRAPIAGRTSIYGEAGLGIASRHGFARGAAPVVRDATYASLLLGAGVEYHLSPTRDFTAGVTFLPSNARHHGSRAVMVDGGFRYTMRPLPPERVEANRQGGFLFREHLVQIEYSTGFGYAINTFLSAKVPVFWEGNVRVDRGAAVHYDRNVFHTRKVFALDLGTSGSVWRSRNNRQRFATVSVYPLFRFTPVRTKSADIYFCYSLAGPTYTSARVLDGRDLGSRFTFQDFMGAGAFIGRDKRTTVGVKINHYSNGNLFSENAGVMVPVTFTVGRAF